MSDSFLQTGIVLAIVLAAACYLGVRVWRTVAAARRSRGEPGCAAGCGCSTGAVAPPTRVARNRRGSPADV